MTIYTEGTCIYADEDIHCYFERTIGKTDCYTVFYKSPDLRSDCGYYQRSLKPFCTKEEALKAVKRLRKRIDKKLIKIGVMEDEIAI